MTRLQDNCRHKFNPCLKCVITISSHQPFLYPLKLERLLCKVLSMIYTLSCSSINLFSLLYNRFSAFASCRGKLLSYENQLWTMVVKSHGRFPMKQSRQIVNCCTTSLVLTEISWTTSSGEIRVFKFRDYNLRSINCGLSGVEFFNLFKSCFTFIDSKNVNSTSYDGWDSFYKIFILLIFVLSSVVGWNIWTRMNPLHSFHCIVISMNSR